MMHRSILSPHTQSRLDYLNKVYDDAEKKYSSEGSLLGGGDGGGGGGGAGSSTPSATRGPMGGGGYRPSASPFAAWAEDLSDPVVDLGTSSPFPFPQRTTAAVTMVANDGHGGGGLFRSHHGRRLEQHMRLTSGGDGGSGGGGNLDSRVVLLESNMRVFRDYLTQLLDQVGSISTEVVEQDQRYRGLQSAVSTFQTHVYSAESNRRFDTGMLSQELQNLKLIVLERVPHAGGIGNGIGNGNGGISGADRGGLDGDVGGANTPRAHGHQQARNGDGGGSSSSLSSSSSASAAALEAFRRHLDSKAEDLFRRLNETLAQQLVTLNKRLLDSERQQQQLITSSIAQAQLRFQAMGGMGGAGGAGGGAGATGSLLSSSPHLQARQWLASSSSTNTPLQTPPRTAADGGGGSGGQESIQHFLDSVLEKLMLQSTEIHRLVGEQDLVRRDVKTVQELAATLQPLLDAVPQLLTHGQGALSLMMSPPAQQAATASSPSSASATRRDINGLKTLIADLQVRRRLVRSSSSVHLRARSPSSSSRSSPRASSPSSPSSPSLPPSVSRRKRSL
jgi:hypothetical protein